MVNYTLTDHTVRLVILRICRWSNPWRCFVKQLIGLSLKTKTGILNACFCLSCCGGRNCTGVWRFFYTSYFYKEWTIPWSHKGPSHYSLWTFRPPRQRAWLLIAKSHIFSNHHTRSLEPCCGNTSLTVFQQFREFFRYTLLRRVTLAHEPSEVLLLHPAIKSIATFYVVLVTLP